MRPPVPPATTASAPIFARLPINADHSVVFEEPAAGHVMLWDATPIGDAATIDSVAFTKDVSVRLAVSALNSLQAHLRRETSTRNHEIVGFMISPQQVVMATSAARLIEFDCFDKGVRVGAGLEPTTGRGTPVPVYLVQDSESRLLHQLKSDRSLHLFAYNANLQKLSFLHLSPRYKLHLVPIIPPGLVTNSVAAKLQSTAIPRTPASGYLAINRARRAYLLRREETNLRLAGLWIAGTKDTSPTRAVFDECVAFTLNGIPKATESRFLLALFPADSATDYAFFQWHLDRDAFLCHAAEFRPATGKYITSALRALDVLGLTRPYAPPPSVVAPAPESEEVEPEVAHEPSSVAAASTIVHASGSPRTGGTAAAPTASSPHVAPPHARTVSGTTTTTTAGADPPATTSTRAATPTVPATDSVASLHQMVWLLMQQVQHLQEQQMRAGFHAAPPPPPPPPPVAAAVATQSVGVNTSFCSTRSVAINTSFDRAAPSAAAGAPAPVIHDDAPLSAADLLPDPPRARAPSPARRSHRPRSSYSPSLSTSSFSSESISQLLESVTHHLDADDDDESLAVDEGAPASDLEDERTCQAITSRVVSADDRFILTADDLAALDASPPRRRRSGSSRRRPRSSVSSGSTASSMSPLSVRSAGSPPPPPRPPSSRSVHHDHDRPHAAAAVHGHIHRRHRHHHHQYHQEPRAPSPPPQPLSYPVTPPRVSALVASAVTTPSAFSMSSLDATVADLDMSVATLEYLKKYGLL
ncbi:hypothetical protein GGF32_005380 [Allomyces javanicus]|nr:hypothetical protein GGF32_005380 [Allomyces javanicus]